MDPAWFYSSLAQTSAAVVGLVGGFLVSKVIDHGAALRASRRDVLERVGALRLTYVSARDRWREGESFIKEWVERIKNRDAYVSAYLWDYEAGKAGPIGPINHVPMTKQLMEQLECVESALRLYDAPLEGKVQVGDLKRRVQDLLETAAGAVSLPGVEKMRPGFAAMISEAENVRTTAGRLDALSAELLPLSVAVLGVLLLGVGALAILWPLSVLCALPGAGKPVMLAALSAGLVGLPAYVAVEVVRLRGLGTVDWED